MNKFTIYIFFLVFIMYYMIIFFSSVMQQLCSLQRRISTELIEDLKMNAANCFKGKRRLLGPQ